MIPKYYSTTFQQLQALLQIFHKFLHFAQNELAILDKFEFANPKTKEAKAFVDAFKFDSSVLVVNDVVLVLLQLVHLVLQGSRDLDGAPGNLLVEARAGEEDKVSQPLE